MCKNCDPSYKGRKTPFCIRADGGDCGMGLPRMVVGEGGGGGGGEVEKELGAMIDAQAAYIAQLDIAIVAQKAELATFKSKLCSVCGVCLKRDFRASGQRLCGKCQPATCTEEGCGKRLFKSWRFVAKCKEHGGREGV